MKKSEKSVGKPSFYFPLDSLQMGATFNSLEEIEDALRREARDRSLPTSLYEIKLTSNTLVVFTCKHCPAVIRFVLRDNKYCLASMMNSHNHQ